MRDRVVLVIGFVVIFGLLGFLIFEKTEPPKERAVVVTPELVQRIAQSQNSGIFFEGTDLSIVIAGQKIFTHPIAAVCENFQKSRQIRE